MQPKTSTSSRRYRAWGWLSRIGFRAICALLASALTGRARGVAVTPDFPCSACITLYTVSDDGYRGEMFRASTAHSLHGSLGAASGPAPRYPAPWMTDRQMNKEKMRRFRYTPARVDRLSWLKGREGWCSALPCSHLSLRTGPEGSVVVRGKQSWGTGTDPQVLTINPCPAVRGSLRVALAIVSPGLVARVLCLTTSSRSAQALLIRGAIRGCD